MCGEVVLTAVRLVPTGRKATATLTPIKVHVTTVAAESNKHSDLKSLFPVFSDRLEKSG